MHVLYNQVGLKSLCFESAWYGLLQDALEMGNVPENHKNNRIFRK